MTDKVFLNTPLKHLSFPLLLTKIYHFKSIYHTNHFKRTGCIICKASLKKIASGLNGISSIVLKTCAPKLAPIFTRLFKISYYSRIFSDGRKTAQIQHITKKPCKSSSPPISIQCINSIQLNPRVLVQVQIY